MNIRNLLKKKEETKPYTRSFRLRNKALEGLNLVATSTQLSTNEVINISMEMLAEEYNLIEEIKKIFENNILVGLMKTTDYGYTFWLILTKHEDQVQYILRQLVMHPLLENPYEYYYYINDIEDLFDFGFDGSFTIVNEITKIPY